jgi:polyhydroxyalkanoate synthesis regulator phasin
MSDLINKALLCGLGLASLTKDAIQKTAEDFVSQSKLSEEEGKKLVADWHRRATEAQSALEKKIDSAVHKALTKLNLARIDEKTKHARPAKKAAKKSRPHAGAKKAARH